MPLALAAVAAAGTIGGALISSSAASSNREAAASAAQKAADIITNTGAPPDLSKQIYMEQFRSAGLLTPEMEKEINVQFEKAHGPNKATVDAQMQALQGLSQSAKGGMTAEERVAQNQIRNKQDRENEAAKNSIIQNMAQRGQAGGGAELAMRLQAAQSGNNAASEESDRVAAAAQARALQSLGQLGNLSSGIRGQEFSENQANANIANEQNRFNVANQISQQSRNIAAKNAAQGGNLTNAQSIMNANVGMNNQERLREANAQRQMWQDQMDQAKAKANAYSGQANNLNSQAQATEARGAGIGAGIGTAAGGAAQYLSNKEMMDKLYPKPMAPGQVSSTPMGPGFNQGGVVHGYNDGGEVPIVNKEQADAFGRALGTHDEPQPPKSPEQSVLERLRQSMGMSDGGLVPQSGLNSEAEYNQGGPVRMNFHGNGVAKYPAFHNGPPAHTHNPSMFTLPSEYASGGRVRGPEIVPGDSPKNDVVHAMLEGGEYVVPKSDAPSMQLIHAILKGLKK